MKSLMLAAMTLTLVQGQMPPDWGYQTLLGDSISVVCNDTEAMVMPGDMLMWHAPDGSEIMNNQKFELMDENNVNNFQLTVNNVQDSDSGVYICKVFRSGVLHIKLNRAINLHEPMYREPIDKYRYDIMIGGIAAAVLFVILVGSCFVITYRVRTREEQEKEDRERNWMKYRTTDIEAGALPNKSMPRNGADFVNTAFDSTNL